MNTNDIEFDLLKKRMLKFSLWWGNMGKDGWTQSEIEHAFEYWENNVE